ncbi:sensor histidine kinase [Pedobacter antarcticus]|nr:histidine kinase [Pedobacter antarcticus]
MDTNILMFNLIPETIRFILDIRGMEVIKKAIASLFEKGTKVHLYFLVGLFLATALVTLQKRDFIEIIPRAFLFYVMVVCCVYAGRWLTRQFLIKNRWAYLILFGGITVIVFSIISTSLLIYLFGNTNEGDVSDFLITTPLFVIIMIFCGGFIAITRTVIQQQINEVKILQNQAETELNLLTNRLSPHFLFNTLNNLYGLSISEHRKVPGLLLKLSALLSYALYSSSETYVKLNDELDYINNFIDLEKVRVSDRLVLNVDITKVNGDINIAPMVLIVFVENAFKHAKNTLDKQIRIDIRIWVDQQFIHFFIKNNCPDGLVGVRDDMESGLGIVTTVKRLDLLYGDNYSLDYGKVKSDFCVNLKIKNDAKS